MVLSLAQLCCAASASTAMLHLQLIRLQIDQLTAGQYAMRQLQAHVVPSLLYRAMYGT